MSEHAHAAPHAHHRNYVKIWAILSALLVVSVVGPMFGIRVVTLITAFGIALVKAYLVAKNFMHLDVEKPIVHWTLGVALILMVVMYAGIAPDVQKSGGQGWTKSEEFHYVHPDPHASGHGDSSHGARGTPQKDAHDSSGH